MNQTQPDTLLPDFDARWKIAIELMHRFFMYMFFPALAEKINFNKPVRSLEKELQKIFADWEKKGWTTGDKLLEYELKDGSSHYVLIHIEAHGGDNAGFKKLQFVRFYRILDRQPDSKLTQIVFYTGETVPPSPDKYVYEFEGTKNVHRFNICIIKNQKREKLEKLSRKNPFALILLASLEHIATKNDATFRRRTKIRLMRLCLESPFKEMIGHLLTFVEFTMALPEDEEIVYREELETLISKPMQALKDLYPEQVKNLEMLIWGKDIDERIAKAAEERAVEIAKKIVKTAKKEAIKIAEEKAIKIAEEKIKIAEEKAIKIAEEKAIKIAEEKAIKIAEEKAIKIAEERVQEKLAEVRKIEKKHILKMRELGLEIEKIAAILEVDQEYVLKILSAGQ